METTSALTIVIPLEFHNKINDIRSTYDPAYPRWIPHINLIFPFVPTTQFNDIKSMLETKLKNYGIIKVELDVVGSFKQKNKYSFHLKPKKPLRLQLLFKIITECLPDVKIKHSTFNPHMTLAIVDANKKDEMEAILKNEFKEGITFNLDRICLLKRSKTDNTIPFTINYEIMIT